jgi:hypothetical protein
MDRANLAYFLEALTAVAALWGEMERAAVLIGAAECLLQEVEVPVYNFYRPDPLPQGTHGGQGARRSGRSVL